jgi:hypothetical protein
MIAQSTMFHTVGIIISAMSIGGHLLYGTLRGIMCRSLVTESPIGHATEDLHDLDLVRGKLAMGSFDHKIGVETRCRNM